MYLEGIEKNILKILIIHQLHRVSQKIDDEQFSEVHELYQVS